MAAPVVLYLLLFTFDGNLQKVKGVVAVCSEPSCPQCRVQMQSRRDCKRDARFDRLLKLLYTNLRSYEAQVRISSSPLPSCKEIRRPAAGLFAAWRSIA